MAKRRSNQSALYFRNLMSWDVPCIALPQIGNMLTHIAVNLEWFI